MKKINFLILYRCFGVQHVAFCCWRRFWGFFWLVGYFCLFSFEFGFGFLSEMKEYVLHFFSDMLSPRDSEHSSFTMYEGNIHVEKATDLRCTIGLCCSLGWTEWHIHALWMCRCIRRHYWDFQAFSSLDKTD